MSLPEGRRRVVITGVGAIGASFSGGSAALGASLIEVDGGHAVCATDPEVLGAAVRQAVDLVVGARRQRRLVRATVRRLRAEAPVLLPIEVASNGEAVGLTV